MLHLTWPSLACQHRFGVVRAEGISLLLWGTGGKGPGKGGARERNGTRAFHGAAARESFFASELTFRVHGGCARRVGWRTNSACLRERLLATVEWISTASVLHNSSNMPNLCVRSAAIVFLVVAFQFASKALGQQSPGGKPPMLVTWFGPGGIPLPDPAQGWKPEMLTVYDNITRPVAQYSKGDSGITVSFILFENASGKPDAQGCRDDAIAPIVKNEGNAISKRVDGELKNTPGETLATTSYLLDMVGGHRQHDLFGFAGNAKTCAEIHVSTVIETPTQDEKMQALVVDFRPDLGYRPNSFDYFILGSLLFKNSPGLAAPYYKEALNTMPNNPSLLTPRRVATDRLVMSLGMSGDLKNSRAVAEIAIKNDPDYPINYYNLACADAEEGNTNAARIHLQQAFDRRANLKGESMPDPTKDDSILKLKKDQEFWKFVLSLPKD